MLITDAAAPREAHSIEQVLLSVVIVNWNSKGDLKDCLDSLRCQTHQALEVIVVDNASCDGSAEMVASEYSGFTLLKQTENLGFAEACNRGIQVSIGSWIAMLNNDAVADPNWAKALVAAAASAPNDCGMLQSLMLYRSSPNTINSTGIELVFSGGGRDRSEGQPYVVASQVNSEEIFCPTAGAAAYRRAMLEAIRLPAGYFDRSHFLYYEDMDLGWRARLAGWFALYIPQAIVVHRWHGSSDRHGKSRLVIMANTNRIRTLLKNASIPFILATAPRTIKELAELVVLGRLKAMRELAQAVVDSLAARRRVSVMVQVNRRKLERTWRAKPRFTMSRAHQSGRTVEE